MRTPAQRPVTFAESRVAVIARRSRAPRIARARCSGRPAIAARRRCARRAAAVGAAFIGARILAAASRTERQARRAPEQKPGGASFVWWRVRDSNPRSLSRLIYSQIPLAAWVTRQGAPARLFQSTGGAITQSYACARRGARNRAPQPCGSGADAVEIERLPAPTECAAAPPRNGRSRPRHPSPICEHRAPRLVVAGVAVDERRDGRGERGVAGAHRVDDAPGKVETGRVTTTSPASSVAPAAPCVASTAGTPRSTRRARSASSGSP